MNGKTSYNEHIVGLLASQRKSRISFFRIGFSPSHCLFYTWQINYYVCKWQRETIIFTKIHLCNAAAFEPIKIYANSFCIVQCSYTHAIHFICFFYLSNNKHKHKQRQRWKEWTGEKMEESCVKWNILLYRFIFTTVHPKQSIFAHVVYRCANVRVYAIFMVLRTGVIKNTHTERARGKANGTHCNRSYTPPIIIIIIIINWDFRLARNIRKTILVFIWISSYPKINKHFPFCAKYSQ